jgi:uncharacterized membrane protein YcaP (DUF421 family)
MESVLRAAATYFIVWLVFRIAGKRSLSEISTFDFVLLLIISETTQAALVDDDNSVMNSILLIATFFTIELALSFLKEWSPRLNRIMDSTPLLIFADGHLLSLPARKERVDAADILEAARMLRGLEHLDQIKYAVLERNGEITIIPKSSPGTT